MKALIFLITLSSFSAFACDQFEAKIIASVDKVKTDGLTYCKAMIEADSIKLFDNPNKCGLNLKELLDNGVDMPLVNGHDCEVYPGEILNGWVSTKDGKTIKFN